MKNQATKTKIAFDFIDGTYEIQSFDDFGGFSVVDEESFFEAITGTDQEGADPIACEASDELIERIQTYFGEKAIKMIKG